MNVQDLEILRDVAVRLSFTAVAEARGVAPSSVSRTISNLEAELGVKLFQRSTRRMALTEAGGRFCDRLDGLLSDLAAAVEEAQGAQRTLKGLLRVTASVAFGEAVLMPLVCRFRELHPGVELELILSDARGDLIGEGLDLAIRLGAKPKGEGICVKLMETCYSVVAAPSVLRKAPKEPHELESRSDVVSLTLPGFRDAWIFRSEAGEEIEVPISAPLRVSSPAGLRAAVLNGAGIGLLADWQVSSDVEAGNLARLFEAYAVTATTFDTAAWAIYPDRRHLPAKVRAMLDFLKANLG